LYAVALNGFATVLINAISSLLLIMIDVALQQIERETDRMKWEKSQLLIGKSD
jgi:ABC-type uncharacterized transport system permease subunit